MTNHTDPVALLEQVYDHAEGVLAEIGPDHHELPTPCAEWNVHELVNHLIGGVHFIASAVAGDEPSAGDPPDFAASQDVAKEFLDFELVKEKATPTVGELDAAKENLR